MGAIDLLAALLLVQDAPPPARDPDPEPEQGEEILVRATFGRTTMLFDKGADGRLHNCRIMVSSGSQRRDTNACQATPVCYEKTRDEVTDCVELTAVEPAPITAPAQPAPGSGLNIMDVTPQIRLNPDAKPAPAPVGPNQLTGETRETERQRVKLPELPKPPGDGPVIRITNGLEDK